MGKSKKLSSVKKLIYYPYLYEIKKREFISLSNKNTLNKYTDITYKDEHILFRTNKPLKNINKINLFKNRIIRFFKKNFIILISFLLSISILYFCQSVIRSIEFENELLYNEDLYNDVINSLEKKGPVYYLTEDLNSLSIKLRSKYSYYEWINIKQVGSKLIIAIDIIDKSPNIVNENHPGDLIAKYDGVVKEILVTSGIVLVIPNQPIKKGDLIVSGNLKYLINPNSTDVKTYIQAKGHVLGVTYETKKYVIPKNTSEIYYTGKIFTKLNLTLFGKKINKQIKPFLDYYQEEVKLLKLSRSIYLSKIYYYEKVYIENYMNLSQAIKYVESMIYKDFLSNKTHKKESIKDIDIINTKIIENDYIIEVLIKKYINLTQFIPHN